MKSFLRFIVFGVLGFFALAACMPAQEPAQTERIDNGEASGGEPVFSEDSGLYPGANLSLIGNGARPQFLNSYADW